MILFSAIFYWWYMQWSCIEDSTLEGSRTLNFCRGPVSGLSKSPIEWLDMSKEIPVRGNKPSHQRSRRHVTLVQFGRHKFDPPPSLETADLWNNSCNNLSCWYREYWPFDDSLGTISKREVLAQNRLRILPLRSTWDITKSTWILNPDPLLVAEVYT